MKLYDVELASRLLLGSARYPSPAILADAVRASGTEVVTVSLRREAGTQRSGQDFWSLIRDLGVRVLPNTAGCHSAKEAVTTAKMARDIFHTAWIKLEVIGDADTLQPDVFGLVGNMAIPGTAIKLSVLVMIVLLIVAFIFERKTVLGRRTYLIGANAEAARLSGINVDRHLTALFILSSLLAGITGILLASEFKAGVSSRAMGYEFDALVVSLLGGVSIAGGFGSVLGMFAGALILSVVTSAATGLLLSPDWQFTLKAIAVFIAILAQSYFLRRRKG